MTAPVHMTLVAGGTEHSPVEKANPELRWNGHAALLAGDGIAHSDLILRRSIDEDAATPEHIVLAAAAAAAKGEAFRRDAVGRVQGGPEHDPLLVAERGSRGGAASGGGLGSIGETWGRW